MTRWIPTGVRGLLGPDGQLQWPAGGHHRTLSIRSPSGWGSYEALHSYLLSQGPKYPDGIQANAGPAKNFVMKQPEVSHPSLPTMWTATVKEDEVGVVHESEHFVAKPTEDNPSAKWTNYTDGSCQRLIREGNNADRMRYLLGCDAVSCCKESGEGPIEYQIPNVHPEFLAHVKNAGKEQLTLFDGSTVEADHWTWSFTVENYNAYTTLAADGSAILHKWLVNAQVPPSAVLIEARALSESIGWLLDPKQATSPHFSIGCCSCLHTTARQAASSLGSPGL